MRIVVVDDDPAVAEVIAEAIRARGDGALVALDLLETAAVDGVFLDLVMPGLSGLAVLARIRSRHPELPVAILSGHADEKLAAEALALGALDVIKKPAVLAHLSDTLARRKGPWLEVGYVVFLGQAPIIRVQMGNAIANLPLQPSRLGQDARRGG